jgi:hypothetical protein
VTRTAGAAFYCVSGRDFFPGAVALLNSLRLIGHHEQFVILDCGLEQRQVDLLRGHATVLAAPREVPPSLLKFAAPRTHPAKVIAVLDADVIVLRPLSELLELAAAGHLVAFQNDKDRFFAQWAEMLELGELRRDHYLTSSALFIGGELATEIMPVVDSRLAAVDAAGTWLTEGAEEDPLYYLDQDVINAVAHSRLDPEQVVIRDSRLAPIPPFRGLRLADAARLRCRYSDGVEPFVLHHASRKPWLATMRSNVYSRLMTRLLLAPDVALRLEPTDLPLRLRTGALASTARLATDIGVGGPGYLRRRILPRRNRAWRDSPH